MRVYARLMKFYPGMTDERLDRMDYMRFFGLLREMRVYQEEVEQAERDAPAKYGAGGNGSTQEISPEMWGELA